MSNLQSIIVLLQLILSLLSNNPSPETTALAQQAVVIAQQALVLQASSTEAIIPMGGGGIDLVFTVSSTLPVINLSYGIIHTKTNGCDAMQNDQGFGYGTPNSEGLATCFEIKTDLPTSITLWDMDKNSPDLLTATTSPYVTTYMDNNVATRHTWNVGGGCGQGNLLYMIQARYDYIDSNGVPQVELQQTPQFSC